MKQILQIKILHSDGRWRSTVRGLLVNEQAIRSVVAAIAGNGDQFILVEEIIEEPIEPIEA